MGLGRKLLGAAKPLWFVAVMGATIAVYSGQAEPYVSPSALPEGPAYMFGGAAVVLVVGWVLLLALERSLDRRAWTSAGRQAGLTPERAGLFGRPDLTGTIDGRTVRARTVTRTRIRGGEDANTQRTFTIVEADLGGSADEGLLVARGEGGVISAGDTTVTIDQRVGEADDRDLTVVEAEGLTFVGDAEPVVEAVRSSPSSSALGGLDGDVTVYAGNAREVVSAALSGSGDAGGGVGAGIQQAMVDRAEDAMVERIPDDPSRASMETLGLVRDGDRLRRQAEAIAAVADAFEEAADASGR